MVIIPWIFTALRGTFIFVIAVAAINKFTGSQTISWYILFFGVPSHVVADFAGFCNVVLSPTQKPTVLGNCYLVLIGLAVVSGFSLGLWEGILVFVEGLLLGFPGGSRRTI